MIRTISSLVLALMFAIPYGGIAAAHPHVWVTVKSEILHDKSGQVTGIRHRWTFDEFYSAFASQGLDTNQDGKFDRKELDGLAEENVMSLKEFDYFTFVKAGGKDVGISTPTDYWLEHVDGVLVLNFTLPLSSPMDARKVASSLAIYDPTYFVAFSFAKKNPIRLAASAPKGCSVALKRRENKTVETASLSEAFFNKLDANSGFGARFAQTIAINCNGR